MVNSSDATSIQVFILNIFIGVMGELYVKVWGFAAAMSALQGTATMITTVNDVARV